MFSDFFILYVFWFINPIQSLQQLSCTNYSSIVTLSPQITEDTNLLLDFRLLSEHQICQSRRYLPRFNKLHIEPASYITTCEQCPQCHLTMPNQYELPLSFTIEKLFVVTRQKPHHAYATDLPIYYILVDRLPTSPLRNCRLLGGHHLRTASYNFQIKFLTVFFMSAFGVMLLVRCFCIKTR